MNEETKALKLEEGEGEEVPLIYNKDGASDSDSSAVLNEFNAATATAAVATNSSFSSPFLFQQQPHQPQQLQLLKVEEDEDEFLAGDDPCSSFFNDEQAPTLSWYCGGGWEQ